MSTVTLRDYVERVETLLHDEDYERAIAWCQHALRTYPKCVDFYRLLGQACLETNRPDDAADMFRRVLGADPQNFVAHVGLGVVAEGIGAADEAVWQWERALEIEPNHNEVRTELRRAREPKDKSGHAQRFKLNRAALGYVCVRGEQYDRAAVEFRAVLDALGRNGGATDRFDLQVALAESLYRGGHSREAADVCQQVLQLLPNALKPNLILADIYLETGRDEEARVLLERAQALDPENRIAAQLLNPPAPLPKRAVTIDEPSSETTVAQPPVATADLSAPAPTPPPAMLAAPPEPTAEVPDWLKALGVPTTAEAAAPTAAVETSAEPDWLTSLRAATARAEAVGATEPTATHDETLASAEASDLLPDWLRAMPQPSEHVVQPEPIVAETVRAELPDWLQESPSSEFVATPTPTPAAEQAASNEPLAPTALAATEPTVVAETAIVGDITTAEYTEMHDEATAAESAAAIDILPAWMREMPAAPIPVTPPAPKTREGSAFLDDSSAQALIEKLRGEPVSAPPVSEPLRAGAMYLDDTAAPPSIETQAAPTGDAEYQARLELARMLVDLDVESALDQYELLASAGPAVRQQAIDDVTALTRTHAEIERMVVVLERLQSGTLPSAPIVDETISAAESPEVTAAEPLPAPAAPIVDETLAEEPPAVAVEAPTPIVSEEAMGVTAVETRSGLAPAAPIVDETLAELPPSPAWREGGAFLDDSSAPPSVQTHATPTGDAEYRARLDLARALKFIDMDTAFDLYAEMAGANEALRQQTISDLQGFAPTYLRAQEILGRLRGVPPVAAAFVEPPQPEWLIEAQTEVSATPLAPSEPVVSEEAMEQAVSAPEPVAEAPAMPVVDEAMAMESPPRAAREGSAFLDDSSAPASIETHILPTGDDEQRARLDLARTFREIDLSESINQYKALIEANSPLLAHVIDDLRAVARAQPAERRARILLADALARAGRLQEAVEQYRLLV